LKAICQDLGRVTACRNGDNESTVHVLGAVGIVLFTIAQAKTPHTAGAHGTATPIASQTALLAQRGLLAQGTRAGGDSGHLRGGSLDAGAFEGDGTAVTGGLEVLLETGVMGRLGLIEGAVTVVIGGAVAGVGAGPGGGTEGTVSAVQHAVVVGARAHVCILHGRPWPRGRGHDCGRNGNVGR
jgi:hypothetical protein